MMQRARIAQVRHRDPGENLSAYCFYATHLRYGDLALDIGANHGEHTREMLRRGARVIAIEPQPDLAEQLSIRYPYTTVLPVAVSDRLGSAVLHLVAEGDVFASLEERWARTLTSSTTLAVGTVTLDSLIAQYGPPAFIKIDTEGHDHCVLQGLTHPVRQIMFEVLAAFPAEARAAFERLDALGSYSYRMSPGNTWRFGSSKRPADIVAALPAWGNVHAALARQPPRSIARPSSRP